LVLAPIAPGIEFCANQSMAPILSFDSNSVVAEVLWNPTLCSHGFRVGASLLATGFAPKDLRICWHRLRLGSEVLQYLSLIISNCVKVRPLTLDLMSYPTQ
jgi:hypothetical protein